MYNFDFKKTLGQNFLKDDNIVNKIVNATEYKKNNLVIEIGPGAGSLTKKLLPKVDKAILYEIDTRLERILNKELAEYDNYTIIFDDFLNRNVNDDLSNYRFDNLYIVANLPYYITHAHTSERVYLGARIYIIRYTSKTRSFKSL